MDSVGRDGVAVVTNGIIPGKVDDGAHENWKMLARAQVGKEKKNALAQGISATMLLKIKIFQEYAFEGLSRTSYKLRWVVKLGMICWVSWPKIVNIYIKVSGH